MAEQTWDYRRLSDSVKTARDFIGKTVYVEGGGMYAKGTLMDVTNKREARIQTEKRGIQGITPVERIEVIE